MSFGGDFVEEIIQLILDEEIIQWIIGVVLAAIIIAWQPLFKDVDWRDWLQHKPNRSAHQEYLEMLNKNGGDVAKGAFDHNDDHDKNAFSNNGTITSTKSKNQDAQLRNYYKQKEFEIKNSGKTGFIDVEDMKADPNLPESANMRFNDPIGFDDLAHNGIHKSRLTDRAYERMFGEKKDEDDRINVMLALVCVSCGAPLSKESSVCPYCGHVHSQ